MEPDPETQAPVVAKRNAGCLSDALRQGIELAAENVGYVVAWVRPATNGDRITGVGVRSGLVLSEPGKAIGQACDGRWQTVHATAGDVLLIQVVLLEQGEPLQFGVGLGECQHRRVSRRDRLDLGVGKFLAADVFGT